MKDLLLGTWSLVSAEDFVSGSWVPSFGETPKGYFSFGADGRISVQFMKHPQSAEDSASPLDAYLAYFGTFEVNENESSFTAVVEGALRPELVGTRQTRPFRFQEGLLLVGDLVTYRRTFRKVRQPPA